MDPQPRLGWLDDRRALGGLIACGLALLIVAGFVDVSRTSGIAAMAGLAFAATVLLSAPTPWWGGMLIGIATSVGLIVVVHVAAPGVQPPSPVWLMVMPVVGVLSSALVSGIRQANAATLRLAGDRAASERQRAVEQVVSDAAHALSASDTLDARVYAALRRFLETVDSDLLMVRRNRIDETTDHWSDVAMWVVNEARVGADSPCNSSYRWWRTPNIRAALERNETFMMASIDDLSPDEYRTWQEARVPLQSGVFVPIWNRGQWLGHLLLADISADRTWTEADVVALRILGDMIGNAWVRHEHTRQLEASVRSQFLSLRAQRALTEGTRLLLSHDDADPLGAALGVVMKALEGDIAYIERFSVDDELGKVSVPVRHLHRDEATREEPVTWALRERAGLVGPLLAGEASVISGPEDDPDARPSPIYEHPLVAQLNVPLVENGWAVGMVGVGTFTPRSWSESDIDVMWSLSRMISAFFQREAATKQLEDLVAAKDRFIASVSHELRTPLSVVVGLAAELQDRGAEFSGAEHREFMGMIRRQSREVSDLIDDLLVSARINETEVTIFPQRFMLDELIGDVMADLPLDVVAKVRQVDLSPVRVVADPLRARQIIRNLIANAHRYGGPDVFITVANVDGLGVLEVADNGAGVPPDRRDAIFEAYQTTGQDRIVTAAIGLGLTVSRQLARLMEGDVTYTHGSKPCFSLRLPLSPVVAVVPEPHRAEHGGAPAPTSSEAG